MVIGRFAIPELPTVEEVLRFPVLAKGDPVVVGGREGLARRVRWVHVSEVPDIAQLLRGGEMMLTTGVALPTAPRELAAYVEGLANANVAALVVGLGPRFSDPLPSAMIEAADRRNLALVALRRKTAFVDVTEDVHAALVDVQIRELQSLESIHILFGDLAVQGATMDVVLRQAARLSGYAIVLENLSHQLLDYASADRDSADVVAEWAEFTRRPSPPERRTSYDPQSGWLTTAVGARGEDWGRLILMTGSAGDRTAVAGVEPLMMLPHSIIVLLERAASTLALIRLVDRERDVVEQHSHRSLLREMIARGRLDRDVEAEAAALDVPIRGRDLIALGLRAAASAEDGRVGAPPRRISLQVLENLRGMNRPALVGEVDDDTVGALVPHVRGERPSDIIDRIAAGLARDDLDVLITVAGPASGVENARAMLREVVDLGRAALATGTPKRVIRAVDLGARGLVARFRDDPHMQRYAENHLGPLIDYDQQNDTDLLGLLEHFLQAGRNKTIASKAAFVSRPWMHEQLRRVGVILRVDLEDEDTCVSLQLAVMIHRMQSGGVPPRER